MITHEPLDLRGLPVWERAGVVLEHLDALNAGETFEFRTEVDPRALVSRLEQLRPAEAAFECINLGDAEWRVGLRRLRIQESASSLSRALARSAVFSKLDGDALAVLAESVSEHTARKGDVLRAENGTCERLGIVLEGALAVSVGAGTRERMLFHVFAGDTFGEVEFFDGGLCMGRIFALSKTVRYATVPYAVVRQIGTSNPPFLLALAASGSQRVRRLASALAAQVAQPIIARVAAALLPYAAPERGLHPALAPLPSMTQAQLAASAGTVKEVAARAIAELERIQALRRERGHIQYLDRSKLLDTIESQG